MAKLIKVREWTDRDTEKVKEIHESMNIGYGFPEISSPLFFQKAIAEKNGEITGAGAIRLIGEAFLWIRGCNSIEKGRALALIYPELRMKASKNGLEDVSAWIPPHIEESFAPILEGMGFSKSPWASWSIKI